MGKDFGPMSVAILYYLENLHKGVDCQMLYGWLIGIQINFI